MPHFETVYQGGPSVDVFGTSGSNPIAQWKVSGGVHKVYDKSVRGYVYNCEWGPTSRMQLPDERKSLGLLQPFLVLQIHLSEEKSFSFELQVSDVATRRRLLFSTSFRAPLITPLHGRIPLGGVARGVWLNLVLDLEGLVMHSFGTKFARLDSIALGSSCKLRRICTLREVPSLGSPGSIEADLAALAPKGFEVPPGVAAATHVFTVETMLAALPADASRPQSHGGADVGLFNDGSPCSSPNGPAPPPLGSSMARLGSTSPGCCGTSCGSTITKLVPQLPAPLQMHHIRSAHSQDAQGRRASPGGSRPRSSTSSTSTPSPRVGAVLRPALVSKSFWRGGGAPEAAAEHTPGVVGLLRRHSKLTNPPSPVPRRSDHSPVNDDGVDLEVERAAILAEASSAADAGALNSSVHLQRKYAELQQRRQRLRQLEDSFERQYGDMASAQATVAQGGPATEGEAARPPPQPRLAPPRRDSLSGPSGPRRSERRPASLAALSPELVPAAAAAVPLPRFGALPNMRIDTHFGHGDEFRLGAAPPSFQRDASPSSHLLARCAQSFGAAVAISPTADTGGGNPRLSAIRHGPAGLSPVGQSAVGYSASGVPDAELPLSEHEREHGEEGGGGSGYRGGYSGEGGGSFCGESGGSADDEAGSDGASESESEAGSLAAARELGLLSDLRAMGGQHSDSEVFSEDEVRTSLAESSEGRWAPDDGRHAARHDDSRHREAGLTAPPALSEGASRAYVPERAGCGGDGVYNPAAYTDEQARRAERVLGGRLVKPGCSSEGAAGSAGAGRNGSPSGEDCGHSPYTSPQPTPELRGSHSPQLGSSGADGWGRGPGAMFVSPGMGAEDLDDDDADFLSPGARLSHRAMDDRAFTPPVRLLSLYKTFFYFKALLWESIIFIPPPPLAKPTLLQYYCTTIAQHTPPIRLPLYMQYNIQYWQWQYRV